MTKTQAKRILQDWIEDDDHLAMIRESWPDLFEAYEALRSIADAPEPERRAQNDTPNAVHRVVMSWFP